MHLFPMTSPMALFALALAAAIPLTSTATTGSLYSLLLEQGIDAFSLLKVHSGRFGTLTLQPYYSGLLCLFTLVVIGSGLALLLAGRRAKA